MRGGWKRQSDEDLPLDESLNRSSSALDDGLPKYSLCTLFFLRVGRLSLRRNAKLPECFKRERLSASHHYRCVPPAFPSC
jgi:hypothetical protein